jgi:hypothetical protein
MEFAVILMVRKKRATLSPFFRAAAMVRNPFLFANNTEFLQTSRKMPDPDLCFLTP